MSKHDKSFRQKFLKHPGPLSKPLTKKGFKRELRSMTKLEFGPQQRQLAQEKRASNLQQQRIGDWFPQYLHQIGQLNQRSNAAYSQAIQGSQQDAATASNYAEKLRQATSAQSAASAAQRGATVSPSVDQTAAQANISRRSGANTFTGLLRSQGATQKAYGIDQKRIGKGEEISQLLQEAARGRQVNQDQRDLATQKRDFADKFLHDTRSQQQDYYLGLLQAQLGQKQAKLSAQTSRANTRATQRGENQRTRFTQQQENQRNRADNRQSNRNSQRSASNSNQGQANKHDRQRAIQHMLALLRTTPPKKLNKMSKQEILSRLLGKSTTYNRSEAKKALKKFNKHKPNKPPVIGGRG